VRSAPGRKPSKPWASRSRGVAGGRGPGAPAFHRDLEAVFHSADGRQTSTGLPGLREGWLDWVSPWATYRVEIEEVIDREEEVVVLTRDLGRYRDSTAEVSIRGAAVWTVLGGKVARDEFFSDRAEALEAVGLQE
jgi:hypothetical protein